MAEKADVFAPRPPCGDGVHLKVGERKKADGLLRSKFVLRWHAGIFEQKVKMMQTKSVIIKNKAGIHCRPSSMIMMTAEQYPDHEILIEAASGSSKMKSILDLLSLGLQCGDALSIKVRGPKEVELAEKLAALFETEFDFI